MKKQIQLNEELIDVDIIDQGPRFVLFNLDGTEYAVNLGNVDDYKMTLDYDNSNTTVSTVDTHFVVDGIEFAIDAPKRSRTKSKSSDHGQMTSPMPGKILKIFVKVGDIVKPGTPILVMEAMKMEHTIKASKNGVIEKIFFKEGDQVQGGVELVKL
ncbi:MAG: acetyl-CoA carboxylase biotin carboxyl carrier protein subunit [Bdellovibrionales bacterium]|nr:acetyl-CoA carboxylase biotin carboxyl carrier protein subunit [Bdellovibrionales bacterium]